MRLQSLLLLPALLLAPTAHAQRIRLTTLLGESTGLVAPVVVAIDRNGATEWRGAITGWTLSGAYTRNVSPTRATCRPRAPGWPSSTSRPSTRA
jgi:hypothetical protein